MSNNINTSRKYKVIVLLLVLSLAIYVLPAFMRVINIDIIQAFDNKYGKFDAVFRSSLFALISSALNVGLSLFFALQLRDIRINSPKGKILSLLILPVLLGDVSIAFIGKVLFAQNTLIHEHALIKQFTLLLIQFWQYGFLFTYIFWLILQNINESILDFSFSVNHTNAERVKDVYLPSLRNVSILCFILNFLFSFFENSKSQFIFKASRGTNSQYISNWLEKYYQSISSFNFETGVNNTLQISILVMFFALLLIITLSLLYNNLFKVYIRGHICLPSIRNNFLTVTIHYLLISGVIVPVLWILIKLSFLSNIGRQNPVYAYGITIIAAAISTIIAIQMGALLRLAWKNSMNSFGRKSIFFYSALLIVLLFPPLVLYIVGFKWLAIIGYSSPFIIKLTWVFGHVILTLPILISFIAVTHYRTTNNEIEFLEAYHLNYWEKLKTLFLRKYLLDYFLTFLIAFSFIWNESTINNLLSDIIPSFISEMKMSISGRGTDYSSGIAYFMVSLSIAMVSIIIWNFVIKKIIAKIG